jgi:inner membrane protein
MINPVQLLGWVAAVFVIISFQGSNLKRLIVLQLTGYLFLATHFILLGATTGAVMTIIGIIRLGVAVYIQKHPEYRRYYLVFIPIILIACWITATGPESLLPAVGYLLGTMAIYQQKLMTTRILFLSAHPFWLAYNFLVGSQGGVAMECFNIISSSTAIVRERNSNK